MSGFPHLERMTSPEVGEAIASGCTTVLFACGAVEQHGPHLPMFTDAEHGTRLAEEVARRLGGTLVAPTVRVGCSEHHMDFAGSLSIRPETLEAVCSDLCVSLSRHGFRHIGIIPSHGGNFGPLVAMRERLEAAVPTACRIAVFADLFAMTDLWMRAVAECSGPAENVGGHADIAESSIMLALAPGLVHPERAERGFSAGGAEDVFARMLHDGLRSLSANGIIGDARGMSVAIGEACIAAVAGRIADDFRATFA